MKLGILAILCVSGWGQVFPFPGPGHRHSTPAVTPIVLLTGGNGYAQCENGSDGCNTTAINTTGAAGSALGVALDCNFISGPGFSFHDSLSNTWTALTTYSVVAGGEQCKLYYSTNMTTGAAQTFGDTGTGSYASVGVLVFKQADTTTPFVTSSDVGVAGVSCSSISPCPPGSVSIAVGNVEVTFFMIPFGFLHTGILPNDTDYVIDGSIHSGSNEGFTIAHLISVTTAARNPAWEPSLGSVTTTTAASSFKHQ